MGIACGLAILDRVTIGFHLVDESDYPWLRGSSSLVKKDAADLRIAFVSLNSRFTFFNRRISSSCALDAPGFDPASTCTCRTHFRSVSVATYSFLPKSRHAAHADGESGRRSGAIRVEHSRISRGYLLAMTDSFRRKKTARNPGRFIHCYALSVGSVFHDQRDQLQRRFEKRLTKTTLPGDAPIIPITGDGVPTYNVRTVIVPRYGASNTVSRFTEMLPTN